VLERGNGGACRGRQAWTITSFPLGWSSFAAHLAARRELSVRS